MTSQELIDIHEAARISGLAPATLYKLARFRRLRSYKVLGALRFSASDIRALVVERPGRTPATHSEGEEG
jgi:predicted DNA-binding transcriptional regulator AlpA